MKQVIMVLALVAMLMYVTMGFGCNKAVLCDDVVTGFQLASSQFPNDKVFAELSRDGHTICEAVRTGNNNIVPNLLKAFVPRFDDFVTSHGQNKGLALADIGIHILLNHFPPTTNATDTGLTADTRLSDYANKPVWGCSYYPEKCKDGVPKQ